MRFNRNNEKSDGISLTSALLLFAGIAVFAGLLKLITTFSIRLDKLSIPVVAVIMIVANVLLGMAFLAIEAHKQKIIRETHLEHTSKLVTAKILTRIHNFVSIIWELANSKKQQKEHLQTDSPVSFTENGGGRYE